MLSGEMASRSCRPLNQRKFARTRCTVLALNVSMQPFNRWMKWNKMKNDKLTSFWGHRKFHANSNRKDGGPFGWRPFGATQHHVRRCGFLLERNSRRRFQSGHLWIPTAAWSWIPWSRHTSLTGTQSRYVHTGVWRVHSIHWHFPSVLFRPILKVKPKLISNKRRAR